MRSQTDRGLPRDIEGYLRDIEAAVDSPTIILFGSMATSFPSRWSDYDFLVIAEGLPEDYWERLELLWGGKPAFVDIVALTPGEIRAKIGRGLILDALLQGEVLRGDASELKRLAAAYVEDNGLIRTGVGYVHG